MAGRPTVVTQDVIRKLETAFMVGCTDLEACCAADISSTALYEHCKRFPEFAERKETLKNRPVMKAKMIVDKALDEDDLPTAHKVIDRKEGSKVDVTSGGEKIANTFNFIPVGSDD